MCTVRKRIYYENPGVEVKQIVNIIDTKEININESDINKLGLKREKSQNK